jgi:hypothetical protein
MVTPVARREAAAHLSQIYAVSQRRACKVIGADRTAVRYRSRRPDDDAIRHRLRELAALRRRFGYRRLHILLDREGVRVNHKKLRRIYGEERLQVRRRSGRKRALGTRAPLAIPQSANQRWSLDFLGDALDDGRRFRILAVVDDAADRYCVSPTTAPSSRARQFFAGAKRPMSNGTTSHPASRPRTPSSRASMAGCATNSSTKRSSSRSLMPARPSPDGRRLQYGSAAQRDRQPAAGHLRQAQRPRDATGRVAALAWGLRAPPRCFTEPNRLK